MRGDGSSNYNGPSGSELVSNAFVFATPAAAQAVWSGFVAATGGQHKIATPSGAPGEQRGLYASSLSIASAGGAITYLFREGNVLAEVELFGKAKQFPGGEVIALANKQSARIRSTLK